MNFAGLGIVVTDCATLDIFLALKDRIGYYKHVVSEMNIFTGQYKTSDRGITSPLVVEEVMSSNLGVTPRND